jgi:hypothetical protein
MRRKNTRGVSILEFSFILLVMIPLLLGTTGIGLNMVNTLQVVQLARDAGHMYARGVDFTQLGNLQILASLGASVGMSTTTGAGLGNARLILSQLRYVDKATCLLNSSVVDKSGNPVGCTNLGQWVFAERITVGNTSLRASTFGNPTAGVTIAADGSITLAQQCTNIGDQASFGVTVLNVYGNVTGLPSGQFLYLAEAEALGFKLPPYATNPMTYSYGIF